MANMLAAHMDLANPLHQSLVQSFWNSPTIATGPGQKAVDMFDAIYDGRIKAVWIMADQSGRQPAGCGPCARSAQAMRTGRRVGLRGEERHDGLSRTCCCLPPGGARKTAR